MDSLIISKCWGFHDAEDSYGLVYEDGTPFHIRGVFLSDRPLDCNEGLPPATSKVFVIEIPDGIIDPYELIEEGKGYREWCLPCRVVNKYFAERDSLKLESLLWNLDESPHG